MGFQRFLDRKNKDRILPKRSNRIWHTKWMPTLSAVFRTLRRNGWLG